MSHMAERVSVLYYVQALYGSLAALPEHLRVEFELRVAEGPFCRSFHLSDAEFARLLRLPTKVMVAEDQMRP